MRIIAAVLVCLAAFSSVPGQDSPLPQEAEVLLDRIEKARARIADLDARLAKETGEDASLLRRRLVRVRMEGFRDIQKLAGNVYKQDEQGLDTTEIKAVLVPMMQEIEPAVDRIVGIRNARLSTLAKQRDEASPSERPIVERRLDNEHVRLDEIFEAYLEHIGNMERLGLDTERAREDLADRLVERAENLDARIELAREQKLDYEARLTDLPGDADMTAELRAAQRKLAGSIRSLTVAVDVMDQIGLDTTAYRKTLIEATGHLTTDVLDAGVFVRLIRGWAAAVGNWISKNGPGILFKTLLLLLILFLFRLLSRVVRKVMRKAIKASKLNFTQLLQDMVVSATGNLIMLLGVLIGLSQLGVTLGPLLAGLGIAGFVLGFALQDSLANFAAGIMILLYRPYDVGDLIESAGAFGTVRDMSLVSTTILTIDHQTLIVPNSKIWGDVIKNVTAQDVRRVDMVFGISYGDDIPHAESVLRSIVESHDKILDDPEPLIKVHELGDSSVNFAVRPWVKTDDYWDVFWDVTREVKLRFDKEGVSIPFPQRDLHIVSGKDEAQVRRA